MQYCTRNPSIKKPELSDASSIIDINVNSVTSMKHVLLSLTVVS